jgi:molecular chaperone GrpE
MNPEKEALIRQFIEYLASEPTLPEYLGEQPEPTHSFDPYQLVAEWTALRQEMKQQGKLLRSAQDTLQQALSSTHGSKAAISLEESQKQLVVQFEQQQEKLLRDLLEIMDALDRACAYWQEEIESLSISSIPKHNPTRGFWGKLGDLFISKAKDKDLDSPSSSSSLSEVFLSNQEGVELIRRSLLDLLRSRRVVPIEAQGKSFDPQIMYAVGRHKTVGVTENTVIQEVVPGYLWGNRVLREAQVIVASPDEEAEELINLT